MDPPSSGSASRIVEVVEEITTVSASGQNVPVVGFDDNNTHRRASIRAEGGNADGEEDTAAQLRGRRAILADQGGRGRSRTQSVQRSEGDSSRPSGRAGSIHRGPRSGVPRVVRFSNGSDVVHFIEQEKSEFSDGLDDAIYYHDPDPSRRGRRRGRRDHDSLDDHDDDRGRSQHRYSRQHYCRLHRDEAQGDLREASTPTRNTRNTPEPISTASDEEEEAITRAMREEHRRTVRERRRRRYSHRHDSDTDSGTSSSDNARGATTSRRATPPSRAGAPDPGQPETPADAADATTQAAAQQELQELSAMAASGNLYYNQTFLTHAGLHQQLLPVRPPNYPYAPQAWIPHTAVAQTSLTPPWYPTPTPAPSPYYRMLPGTLNGGPPPAAPMPSVRLHPLAGPQQILGQQLAQQQQQHQAQQAQQAQQQQQAMAAQMSQGGVIWPLPPFNLQQPPPGSGYSQGQGQGPGQGGTGPVIPAGMPPGYTYTPV